VKKATLQKLGLGALGILGGVLLLGAKPARGHGTIVARGVSYTPTMDEWLWFARACLGESSELEGQTAAGWAMVARFAALRQTVPAWREKSFSSFVLSFSQPVNPLWSSFDACTHRNPADLEEGEMARGCCGTRCTQAQLDRRHFIQSRSWQWLREREPELYFMVMSFAAGVPPANLVPGMTNFAACNQTRCNDTRVGGNCFCGEPTLDGSVSVVPRQ